MLLSLLMFRSCLLNQVYLFQNESLWDSNHDATGLLITTDKQDLHEEPWLWWTIFQTPCVQTNNKRKKSERQFQFVGRVCKVLPNKDHATCGREKFWGIQTTGLPPWLQGAVAWVKWVVCIIGGSKLWGRERVSGLWLSVITRWNRSTWLASWVTGSSWSVLQVEKQSGREKQVVINQGFWIRC
jgi:hypothetical protein